MRNAKIGLWVLGIFLLLNAQGRAQEATQGESAPESAAEAVVAPEAAPPAPAAPVPPVMRPVRPPAPVLGESSTRLFEVQHADIRRLDNLLGGFRGAPLSYGFNEQFIVATGSEEYLNKLQEMLKVLDVPAPPTHNVEITVYLIQGQAIAENAEAKACPPVPEVLNTVMASLKSKFNYAGYCLMETLLMRARDGESTKSYSMLPSADKGVQGGAVEFSVGEIRVSDQGGTAAVHMDNICFSASIPARSAASENVSAPVPPRRPGNASMNVGFTTNVDVVGSDPVVVGKSTLSDAQGAVFLVIMVNVI